MFMVTTEKGNVGVYLRLSKEDINSCSDSQSIQNQRSLISDYASKNGLLIYDYYVDDGYSGGNFERPAFKRLIKDIDAGNIDVVITKDISRLGRDFIETSHYIFKYFPEKNIRYISILDNFDTMQPNGMEDIIPFQTIINDMYLKDTSKKIKSVRHSKMRAGLFVGSCVAYGYKRDFSDNRKFVVDEYAAGVVKRIFNMKVDGLSNVMIARTLTNEGIDPPNVYNNRNINKTYTTNLWKASTIGTILKNEVYVGNLVQHKYDRINYRSKKKRLLPKNEWIIVKNNHEPIISIEIFNYINNCGSRGEFVRKRKYDYLLKGLVVCAECRKNMVVRKEYRKKDSSGVNRRSFFCCKSYVTYRNGVCSMHYFKEEHLNKIVFSRIKDLLNNNVDKKRLNLICFEFFRKKINIDKMLSCIEGLRRKKENVNRALESLYMDKATGVIDEEEFRSIKNGLDKRIFILEEQIKNSEVRLKKIKGYQEMFFKVVDEFFNLDVDNKLYRGLIKKIEIDQNKIVKIHFNFFIG